MGQPWGGGAPVFVMKDPGLRGQEAALSGADRSRCGRPWMPRPTGLRAWTSHDLFMRRPLRVSRDAAAFASCLRIRRGSVATKEWGSQGSPFKAPESQVSAGLVTARGACPRKVGSPSQPSPHHLDAVAPGTSTCGHRVPFTRIPGSLQCGRQELRLGAVLEVAQAKGHPCKPLVWVRKDCGLQPDPHSPPRCCSHGAQSACRRSLLLLTGRKQAARLRLFLTNGDLLTRPCCRCELPSSVEPCPPHVLGEQFSEFKQMLRT